MNPNPPANSPDAPELSPEYGTTMEAPPAESSFGDILLEFEQSQKPDLRGGETVQGKVVAITSDFVYVDVGRKMEGLLKPDAARAAAFISGSAHLWNAGIFVFRADVMRAAVTAHLPAVSEALDAFDAAAKTSPDAEVREVAARYPMLPNISVDYGVMEKVSEVAVVPVSCGWSDVGSWQASWELGAKDERQNVVRGALSDTVLVDASGNVVVSSAGKVVALVGVRDLVVVDTPDALLVVPRERAQDVKKAVDALTAARRDDVL